MLPASLALTLFAVAAKADTIVTENDTPASAEGYVGFGGQYDGGISGKGFYCGVGQHTYTITYTAWYKPSNNGGAAVYSSNLIAKFYNGMGGAPQVIYLPFGPAVLTTTPATYTEKFTLYGSPTGPGIPSFGFCARSNQPVGYNSTVTVSTFKVTTSP